jgi:ABC-type glycerol-3-phosphate transport system substrate-binding protein
MRKNLEVSKMEKKQLSRRSQMRRWTVLLTAALVLAVVLTGCRNKSGEAEGHTTIRWYQDLRGDIQAGSDPILAKMEELNNIKFDFIDVPSGDEESNQKLALMLSSGEVIDLATSFRSIDNLTKQWVRDDVLYAFDDFFAEGKYPALEAVCNADIYKYLKINDKTYFKALPLGPGNRGYVINQDWLDAVGLGIPATLEEYYTMLKAFVQKDPNGNGKQDEYGFFVAEPIGANAFGYICRAFVNCGAWGGDWCELPDGTITPFVASNYAREAFRFINRCYNEGLFNKSFVNEKDAEGKMEDLMVSGQVAMMDVTGVTGLARRFEDAGVKANITYLPPLKTLDGKQGTFPHTGGSWGVHLIPKSAKNPEAAVAFLEWALSEEGRELTMYGIKGMHFNGFTYEGSVKVYDVIESTMGKYWNTTDYGYAYPISWGGPNYDGGYIPIKENGYSFDVAYPKQELWTTRGEFGGILTDLKIRNAQYAKTFPLQSTIEDSVLIPQELTDIEIEGRTKAIVGTQAEFDANWDAMLKTWYDAGGQAYIDAGNKEWKRLQQ